MTGGDELQIRGGAGGISARLDDLHRVAHLLRAAASDLAGHGARVLAVAADPELVAGAVFSPRTFARAEAALLRSAVGPHGLAAVAAALEALALRLTAVALAYRNVEIAVTLRMKAVEVGTGAVEVGALTLGLAAVATAGPGAEVAGLALLLPGPRPVAGRALSAGVGWAAGHGSVVDGLVRAVPDAAGGLIRTLPVDRLLALTRLGAPADRFTVAESIDGLASFSRVVGAASGHPTWVRDSSGLQVRLGPPRSEPPPTGLGDLLARIPPATGRPRLHLERISGPGGRRWVVSVPGTADWSPAADRTPFDLTGDLRLLGAQHSAGMSAVVTAMRAAGIAPGEPVLLVGHSQGGMVAAALAADPEVRRDFAVTHVVTAGAPIGSVPVPAGIQVLSIEHTDDLVPGLDGQPNQDRPNWITVSAPTPSVPPAGSPSPVALKPGVDPNGSGPGLPVSVLLAHDRGVYRLTAAAIDRSPDPTLAVWRAGAAGFIGTPGSDCVGWDVDVSRSTGEPG